MEEVEKLTYSRDWLEVSVNVTDANAEVYFNKSIEIMIMLWYPKKAIEDAVNGFEMDF